MLQFCAKEDPEGQAEVGVFEVAAEQLRDVGEAIQKGRAVQVERRRCFGDGEVIIPVYIHRSGFTGENGYEIYSAFDKSAEVHDLALKAVASVGGRELQTLEVYVRSIPMEKGFALKQDFKHLSPYECGLGWAVAADKDFIGKEAALARKEYPKYRMVGLEFSRESTEDISIWERVYWYGVEVGRCAQTIYGYTVDKNIGFATVRADVPDGAELTVGCNDSPAVVVNKVFC